MKDDVKKPGPAKTPPEPGVANFTGVDVEKFANNLARMVEQGGKALAAYMKPREEGQIKAGLSDEVADMVKTLGLSLIHI